MMPKIPNQTSTRRETPVNLPSPRSCKRLAALLEAARTAARDDVDSCLAQWTGRDVNARASEGTLQNVDRLRFRPRNATAIALSNSLDMPQTASGVLTFNGTLPLPKRARAEAALQKVRQEFRKAQIVVSPESSPPRVSRRDVNDWARVVNTLGSPGQKDEVTELLEGLKGMSERLDTPKRPPAISKGSGRSLRF